MKKFRFLSAFTAIALSIALAGCSGNNVTSGTQSETTSAPDTISLSEAFTETPETVVTSETADTTALASSEKTEKNSGLRYNPGVGTLDEEPDTVMRRKANNVKQIVGTLYDGTPVNENFYYYRCALNNAGKSAYDTIHAGLLTGTSTIKLSSPISVSDVDIVYYSVLYDDPEIVWAEPGYNYTYNNSGNVTSISPMYNKLAKDISGTKKALEKSVSGALAVMWSLPNNIERSKYAHDYLTHTIDYVENDLDQNAYSALVQHKTVCAGYSQAFAYMMQKMGAPCAVLIGYAGEDHAWNIVMLNGENYVTDVTWDDPYGNPPNTYYYDYFNITSKQMSRDHTLQSPSTYLPSANGTYASYNSYFKGNAYPTDFNNPTVIGGSTPAVTTTKPATTTKPPVYTTKPNTTTTFDWDSYWDDDWWSQYDIDPSWFTTTTTKPPVYTTKPTTTTKPITTTKPPVYTTKPNTTTTFDWDSYWNDDWWSQYGIDPSWFTTTTTKPPVYTTKPTTTTKPITTTKPPVYTTKPTTTTFDWDSWDDWWNDYDYWDSNNSWNNNSWNNNWNDWNYNIGQIGNNYNYDFSDYFSDYYYSSGNSSSDGWWNYLDPYWTKADWTDEGDGLWSIDDEETGFIYMYDEESGMFFCIDDDGSIYWYDSSSDTWELYDDAA